MFQCRKFKSTETQTPKKKPVYIPTYRKTSKAHRFLKDIGGPIWIDSGLPGRKMVPWF